MPRPADRYIFTTSADSRANRVIDRRDGSILPLRDTGFRMNDSQIVVSNRALRVIKSR